MKERSKKMIRRIVSIIPLLLVVLLVGCDLKLPEKEPKPVVKNDPVESFNEITLMGEGFLTITQGESESLQVEAETLDIRKIQREVVGDELLLRTDMLRSPIPIYFNVTVKDLTKVSVSGPGQAHLKDLSLDTLELDMRGVGESGLTVEQLEVAERLDLIVRGTTGVSISNLVAPEATFKLYGTGNVSASGEVEHQQLTILDTTTYQGEKLQCSTAEITMEGSDEAILSVQESLDISLPGSGTIKYHGNPTVSGKVTGSGKVKRFKAK
jgi:hypothetical protein